MSIASKSKQELLIELLRFHDGNAQAEDILDRAEKWIEEKVVEILNQGVHQYSDKNNFYFCKECYKSIKPDQGHCSECGGQVDWDLTPMSEITKDDLIFYLSALKKEFEEYKQQSISTSPHISGVKLSSAKLVEIAVQRAKLQEEIIKASNQEEYQKIEEQLKQLNQEELEYLRLFSIPLEGGTPISDDDLPF